MRRALEERQLSWSLQGPGLQHWKSPNPGCNALKTNLERLKFQADCVRGRYDWTGEPSELFDARPAVMLPAHLQARSAATRMFNGPSLHRSSNNLLNCSIKWSFGPASFSSRVGHLFLQTVHSIALKAKTSILVCWPAPMTCNLLQFHRTKCLVRTNSRTGRGRSEHCPVTFSLLENRVRMETFRPP